MRLTNRRLDLPTKELIMTYQEKLEANERRENRRTNKANERRRLMARMAAGALGYPVNEKGGEK